MQEPDNGNVTDFKQFSEELRLAGKTDRLNWLVGGFSDKELLNNTSTILADNQLTCTRCDGVGGRAVSAANFLLVPELTGNSPDTRSSPAFPGKRTPTGRPRKASLLHQRDLFADRASGTHGGAALDA